MERRITRAALGHLRRAGGAGLAATMVLGSLVGIGWRRRRATRAAAR